VISELEIVGFKRFQRQSFDLAPLTILAGLNGTGKTSFIQALLIAWEASSESAGKVVRLNGPFGLDLGTAEDVRNWKTDGLIEFHVKSAPGSTSVWKFEIPSDDALYLKVIEKPEPRPAVFREQARAFSYLCAERLGPRSSLGTSPLPVDALEIGSRGEYCAQLLSTLGNEVLGDSNRMHPEAESPVLLLKYQVEQWLAEITRPIELDAVWYPGTAFTALRFRSPGGDWVRAPNMGFGVSYSLPIILAGLTARSDGLMIVENPEAHLHPAGQSRMGVFLAWLAAHGVQVIVETHSDHVLNGIRRGIGEHNFLKHDSAIVHFFESLESDEPKVHKLDFTPIGGVSHWPPGFFDQYQIDVASLGRIRRRS